MNKISGDLGYHMFTPDHTSFKGFRSFFKWQFLGSINRTVSNGSAKSLQVPIFKRLGSKRRDLDVFLFGLQEIVANSLPRPSYLMRGSGTISLLLTLDMLAMLLAG